MDPYIDAVRNVGIPALMLLGVGWGAYKSCGWLAEHVIKPVVSHHLDFLGKLSVAVDRLVKCLEELSVAIQEVKARNRERS